MSRVMQAISAIARHEVNARPFCELGVVTSVFDSQSGDDAQSVSITLKDSGLAIPRVPVAVGLCGTGALPREGDVVVVLFPRGDLSSPIIMSLVYSDQRRPPEFTKDEAKLVWPGDNEDPDTKAVQISIKADGDAREVNVLLGGDKNACLKIKDGEVEMTAGMACVKLSHSSDSDATCQVSAGGTKISLSQDGDMTIESKGKLTLKGSNVAIEGDSQVTINGQTVEIN